MDEFDLIHSITPPTIHHSSVDVGIGDDAAVYTANRGVQEIVCVDTMVEDVHFKLDYSSPQDIGYKALAVNISDIAAMGGFPKFYLVSIAVPTTWQASDVRAMYEGMNELAKLYQMDLIGGDSVSTSDKLVVTVTVIGEVEQGRACLRSSAKPNDIVFVTGELGCSAAGLSLLLEEFSPPVSIETSHFIKRHKRPEPRVMAGRLCSAFERVALNDISDGLASELNEIAEASSVTIEIEESLLPVRQDLSKLHPQWQKWALFGGEDFELTGTISNLEWDLLKEQCKKLCIPIKQIGVVIENTGSSVILNTGSQRMALEKKGYNHFR
ncbi:thiamine-phosphate kinase [Bacillus atrophaeus]|uniref:thiamine-phosphate kinase n=1 Tax=Bacillus atrophaeus TaxID=1452 RepID=UPI0022818E9A|nr:thiamine-phosphate kinase [Bacillus atrophaeus]MCY8907174.1 thiamine-phosphate kinase [Bacillus atrophaeus]MEC0838826.1 thiamine-phosphate kinase [Bacillus atrophaeus]MEC0846403.1 thiamine-phosphate kinase [Bacillus atrophaeus]MEC0851598.1 thiamine-phosphate kinase [Bacillus atrophaeus]MEC0865159.1 thiamine-phosphate kinase [Bacillus atrophaeus]